MMSFNFILLALIMFLGVAGAVIGCYPMFLIAIVVDSTLIVGKLVWEAFKD